MDAKEAKRLVKEAAETTAKDRYKTVLDDLLQAIRERSNEGYSSILIKAYEDDDHLLARLVNELKSKGFEVITYKLYLAIFWE